MADFMKMIKFCLEYYGIGRLLIPMFGVVTLSNKVSKSKEKASLYAAECFLNSVITWRNLIPKPYLMLCLYKALKGSMGEMLNSINAPLEIILSFHSTQQWSSFAQEVKRLFLN